MKILMIGFLSAFLFSCSDGDKAIMTYTKDEISYVNEYFDLNIVKPNGWYSQSAEDTIKQSQVGTSIISGDDESLKAVLEESLKTSIPLFAFYEYMPGTPGKTNANIIAIAENISLLPGIKSGCDYLYHARNLLVKSAYKPEVTETCKTISLNQSKLGYLDVTMKISGIKIKQKYYACVQGEHVISTIQTYFDEASKAKVDDVMKTLELSCN